MRVSTANCSPSGETAAGRWTDPDPASPCDTWPLWLLPCFLTGNENGRFCASRPDRGAPAGARSEAIAPDRGPKPIPVRKRRDGPDDADTAACSIIPRVWRPEIPIDRAITRSDRHSAPWKPAERPFAFRHRSPTVGAVITSSDVLRRPRRAPIAAGHAQWLMPPRLICLVRAIRCSARQLATSSFTSATKSSAVRGCRRRPPPAHRIPLPPAAAAPPRRRRR